MDDMKRIDQMVREGRISKDQAHLLKKAYQISENRQKGVKQDIENIKTQRKNGSHQFAMSLFLISFCLILITIFFTKAQLSGTALFFLLIFFVFIFSGVWGIFLLLYNHLSSKEESVHQSWAQVEAEYQRRIDLIPSLVEILTGYVDHEKETLRQVVEARGKAQEGLGEMTMSDLSVEGKLHNTEEMQNRLDTQLKTLFVLAEQYPDLKANVNYLTIQKQIEETENAVANARQKFNERVGHYNAARRMFPTFIIAGLFSFHEKNYFKQV